MWPLFVSADLPLYKSIHLTLTRSNRRHNNWSIWAQLICHRSSKSSHNFARIARGVLSQMFTQVEVWKSIISKFDFVCCWGRTSPDIGILSFNYEASIRETNTVIVTAYSYCRHHVLSRGNLNSGCIRLAARLQAGSRRHGHCQLLWLKRFWHPHWSCGALANSNDFYRPLRICHHLLERTALHGRVTLPDHHYYSEC